MQFTDKIALITGGTRGMGFAAAKRLLDDGATVVITGRDETRLEAAATALGHPTRVMAVRADAAIAGDVDRLASTIRDRHGRLDLLFANAGVAAFKPLTEFSEQDIDQLISVNLTGVILTIRGALPLLVDNGSIVINASWTVHRGLAGATVYAATKAAVRNLARTLSADLAERRIRVNAVSPGYIKTDMFDDAITGEDAIEAVRRQIVLGRIGTAEDVADAVAFLLSDQARYITGHDLIIDGGIVDAIASSPV
ncbi:MAG TPA: SDR family oxidoreductase [Solirubrobacteraceae bacterium]|nr:SDR family oxidoreductase [Solirubrobacteraceae bacterium]